MRFLFFIITVLSVHLLQAFDEIHEHRINDLRKEYLEIARIIKQLSRETDVELSKENNSDKKDFLDSKKADVNSSKSANHLQLSKPLALSSIYKNEDSKRYYIGFNLGAVFFEDQDYLGGIGDITIQGETGFLAKICIERNFDNFLLAVGFSFMRQKHYAIDTTYLGAIECEGRTNLLTGFIGASYKLPVTQNLSLSFSSEIGWVHSDLELNSAYFGQLESKGFLVTGALGTKFRYNFTDSFYANFAYEYKLVGKDYPFSSYTSHCIFTGVGLSF